jgi:hypothetical protein
MSTVSISPPIHREPELSGQTVVVNGGSAGIDSKQHAAHVRKGPR